MSEESSKTTVECQVIQDRTLPVIASEILTIERQVEQTALAGAIEIGYKLQEAKEIAGHGEFGTWCVENLNYSQRKAERFMKLSAEYEAGNWLLTNSTISSKVSVFKALSLLALPDEEAENFVEEHDIEEMSVKEIDEEVRKLKEEKEKAERAADAWKAMKEETEKALALNEQAMENLQNDITQLQAQLRIKEEEQSPEADTSEYENKISELEKKLQASKTKEEKLKSDIKDMQAKEKEHIDAEVASVRESLYEQVKAENRAEIDRANELNCELQTMNDELQKRLKNVSDETMVKFKVFADQMQDAFHGALEIMRNAAQTESERMGMALEKVLRSMIEEI